MWYIQGPRHSSTADIILGVRGCTSLGNSSFCIYKIIFFMLSENDLFRNEKKMEFLQLNMSYQVKRLIIFCNHTNKKSAMGTRWWLWLCPALQRASCAWQRSHLLTSADLLQGRKVHYCSTKVLGIELTLSTSLGPQREPFRFFNGCCLDGLPVGWGSLLTEGWAHAETQVDSSVLWWWLFCPSDTVARLLPDVIPPPL